jgi:hypothetical protein
MRNLATTGKLSGVTCSQTSFNHDEILNVEGLRRMTIRSRLTSLFFVHNKAGGDFPCLKMSPACLPVLKVVFWPAKHNLKLRDLFLLCGAYNLSRILSMGITDVAPDKNIRGFIVISIINYSS